MSIPPIGSLLLKPKDGTLLEKPQSHLIAPIPTISLGIENVIDTDIRLALGGWIFLDSRMMRFTLILICLAVFLRWAAADPAPLESIGKCELVPTDWGDGDSFLVRTQAGVEHTIRIYAADCFETRNADDTEKRRLSDQRRYFGITGVKGDAVNSVALAMRFGTDAKKLTQELLKKPFTIHTRFHKAPGDGQHQRYYAFVETSEGKDLATELVKAGLARVRGVATDRPDQMSRDRYKQQLADLEILAGRKNKGVWKFTDWDKLPEERDLQRKEDEDDQAAAGNGLAADFRLDPNTASRDDLDRLPGIGEILADAIIEAREDGPFTKPEDILRVPGIKQKTFEKFRQYLEIKAH